MAAALTFSGVGAFNLTTAYTPIGANNVNAFGATEADLQYTTHQAGTFSKLQIYITANASSSVVFRFRKNLADGNQLVSPNTGTGYFEDTSNSDTVADGDEVNYVYTAANTSVCTILPIAMLFTPTSGVVTRTGASAANTSITAAATDHFQGYFREIVAGTTIEAAVYVAVETVVTIKNLFTFVKTNARTTTTDIRSRKNSADGNLVVQYTSGQTGVKEDTSNSDVLAAGDLVAYVIRTAAVDTNSIVVTGIWTDAFNTSGATVYETNVPGASTVNTTRYLSFGRASGGITTEAQQQLKADTAGTFSKSSVNVSANANTGTSELRLRKNAADGNILISIGSGVTGILTDLVNTDTVAATDLCDWDITTGATGGNLTMRAIQVAFTPDANVVKDLIMMGIIPFARA